MNQEQRPRPGGALRGLRVVEFAGIGPGPFAGMMLADMGADVVLVDRPGPGASRKSYLTRGKRSVCLNLKRAADVEAALDLLACADAVIEGFRPGVMERLGLGPDVALALNPRLVYGRMTGWGQTGPLAQAAGHDINYIAITGALASIVDDAGKPVAPLNFVGDLGGGAMFLVAGMLAATLEARLSGKGQVVDAAISDGVNTFTGFFHALREEGRWGGRPGENILDGGSHFYNTYACADGLFVAIGAIEPPFYALLRQHAGLDDAVFDAQLDEARWPELKERLAAVFRTRTRAEWCAILEGTDACFAPVLSLAEAPAHRHNLARNGFETIDGRLHPAPSPRFSRTPSQTGPLPRAHESHANILRNWSQSPPA